MTQPIFSLVENTFYLEERFKVQRLYGDELSKYKDEDIEIDRYTIDDGMNLIYVIEVYEKT